MEIKLVHFDKFLDHLVELHYYFLFFLIGMMVAAWYIKKEMKLDHEDQLNRIFFGSHAKDEKHG